MVNVAEVDQEVGFSVRQGWEVEGDGRYEGNSYRSNSNTFTNCIFLTLPISKFQ